MSKMGNFFKNYDWMKLKLFFKGINLIKFFI